MEMCISINSLTKVHGLGSIRFGWIVASKEVAKRAQDVFRTVEGMISSPSVRIAEEPSRITSSAGKDREFTKTKFADTERFTSETRN